MALPLLWALFYRRQPIPGRFTLLANNSVGFSVGSYDHSQPLVIDPVLAYSTFLGDGETAAQAISVDQDGNAYLTGYTNDINFPVIKGKFSTTSPSQSGAQPVAANFVTKLNPHGTELVYSTYLGGKAADGGNALALDIYGETYLGGTFTDSAASLAVDGSGILVYVAGVTTSPDFPVTEGAFQTTSNEGGAFVAKLNLGAAATATRTTLASSANPQILGRTVTFTATVRAIGTGSAPTGNVIFFVELPAAPYLRRSDEHDALPH